MHLISSLATSVRVSALSACICVQPGGELRHALFGGEGGRTGGRARGGMKVDRSGGRPGDAPPAVDVRAVGNGCAYDR